MKAPLSLTLAVLATAFPLAAQTAPSFLCGDSDGEFHDLGIVELVDATNALIDPVPSPKPARCEAPDASQCTPDSLLFSDQHPLTPGEPSSPGILQTPTEASGPPTRESVTDETTPPGASSVPAVGCPDCAAGATVPASQPVLAGATPVPVDQVPEPSAILLVLGAAAWILLRRKY